MPSTAWNYSVIIRDALDIACIWVYNISSISIWPMLDFNRSRPPAFSQSTNLLVCRKLPLKHVANILKFITPIHRFRFKFDLAGKCNAFRSLNDGFCECSSRVRPSANADNLVEIQINLDEMRFANRLTCQFKFAIILLNDTWTYEMPTNNIEPRIEYVWLFDYWLASKLHICIFAFCRCHRKWL